jgi:hypothetical protein
MESKASALEVILSKQLESKPDGVQSFSFGGQFIQTIGIQTRWSPKLQLWRSIYPNNWNPNLGFTFIQKGLSPKRPKRQMESKASALEVNLSKQLESKLGFYIHPKRPESKKA